MAHERCDDRENDEPQHYDYGVIHATTISQAANTLNVILKTDENGTWTSVIATFVPGNPGGDVVKTLVLGDAAGSSVPSFSIGSIRRLSASRSSDRSYTE